MLPSRPALLETNKQGHLNERDIRDKHGDTRPLRRWILQIPQWRGNWFGSCGDSTDEKRRKGAGEGAAAGRWDGGREFSGYYKARERTAQEKGKEKDWEN